MLADVNTAPDDALVSSLNDRLAHDGYAVVEDFIAPAEVQHLLDVFRTLDCATHHGGWNASMFSSDVHYRAAVDLAIKEALGPRASSLIPGYRLCFSNFLVKEPAANGVVQIHQDPTFVDEERWDTLGLWVPLVDTDATNGAIAVIPGSHRWNRGPRNFGVRPSPYVSLSPTLFRYARPLPMKAGSALVFSQKLFHGSPANRGGAPRITAAVLMAQTQASLHCYYANPAMPEEIEVFEVDDLFYTRYPYATRPEGVPRVAVVDHWHDPILPAQLNALSAHEHVVRE